MSKSSEVSGGQTVTPEEGLAAHLRPLRLPLVRMVLQALCLCGVVAGLGGIVGVVAVSGSEWWWAPGGAACAFLGGVLGLLVIQPLAERTAGQWASMMFLGQFVSLFATGLLVWALLYSSPQPSPLLVLPTASVSFVMVWIAFAQSYGVALRAHSSGRGV